MPQNQSDRIPQLADCHHQASMADPTLRKGTIHSCAVCVAPQMMPGVEGAGTQVWALEGSYGGRRKGGGPLVMASLCSMKPLLMDGPKPNSMVYTLGLSFPSVGVGRKAGPTRLKSFHADPTHTWGMVVRRRQGDSRKQGWFNLFSQPCRVACGHRQHLRQLPTSPPAIKRDALWDVSRRLHPMDLPQGEVL